MQTTRVALALSVLSLLACDQSEPTEDTVACPQSLTAAQGRDIQGMNWQGIGLQGSNWQGINWQGMRFQGSNWQGVNWQGRSPQGVNWQGLQLRGSELVAFTADGRLIQGEAFVGAQLAATDGDGRPLTLVIRAITRAEPDVVLYRLELDGHNVCEHGDGLFLAGTWDSTGAHRDGAGVTYACPQGVLAKCVRWGYKPWSAGREAHQACTRMARADYCGDGVPHTREGTLIDMFDDHGVQRADNPAGFSFEAGWGPDGAVCVREPRYVFTDGGGRARRPSCWDSKPRCDDWTAALHQGAILGNASAHTRLACH